MPVLQDRWPSGRDVTSKPYLHFCGDKQSRNADELELRFLDSGCPREKSIHVVDAHVQRFTVQLEHFTHLQSTFAPDRHVSFVRICNCRIFRIFQQSAHITYFSSINWHFDHHFNIICVSVTYFYWVLLPRPSGCQQNGTNQVSGLPVERDGVVGFKQLRTIFPHILPYIWCLCGTHILKKKCCVKLTRLSSNASVYILGFESNEAKTMPLRTTTTTSKVKHYTYFPKERTGH